LKRLLGRTVQDVEIQQVEKGFTHVNLVDVDGSVGVQVSICGDLLFDEV
jgi:heat shock protein 4